MPTVLSTIYVQNRTQADIRSSVRCEYFVHLKNFESNQSLACCMLPLLTILSTENVKKRTDAVQASAAVNLCSFVKSHRINGLRRFLGVSHNLFHRNCEEADTPRQTGARTSFLKTGDCPRFGRTCRARPNRLHCASDPHYHAVASSRSLSCCPSSKPPVGRSGCC